MGMRALLLAAALVTSVLPGLSSPSPVPAGPSSPSPSVPAGPSSPSPAVRAERVYMWRTQAGNDTATLIDAKCFAGLHVAGSHPG
jgi:hypothetical protein